MVIRALLISALSMFLLGTVCIPFTPLEPRFVRKMNRKVEQQDRLTSAGYWFHVYPEIVSQPSDSEKGFDSVPEFVIKVINLTDTIREITAPLSISSIVTVRSEFVSVYEIDIRTQSKSVLSEWSVLVVSGESQNPFACSGYNGLEDEIACLPARSRGTLGSTITSDTFQLSPKTLAAGEFWLTVSADNIISAVENVRNPSKYSDIRAKTKCDSLHFRIQAARE